MFYPHKSPGTHLPEILSSLPEDVGGGDKGGAFSQALMEFHPRRPG